MPTHLYGPGDSVHPTHSHAIPAPIRRFHEARVGGASEVGVRGTGAPPRDFMDSDDMAEACVFLLKLNDERHDALLGRDDAVSARFEPPIVDIGTGEDCTIDVSAGLVARVVDEEGRIV
jgi:GDP-L-fucose synthase